MTGIVGKMPQELKHFMPLLDLIKKASRPIELMKLSRENNND